MTDMSMKGHLLLIDSTCTFSCLTSPKWSVPVSQQFRRPLQIYNLWNLNAEISACKLSFNRGNPNIWNMDQMDLSIQQIINPNDQIWQKWCHNTISQTDIEWSRNQSISPRFFFHYVLALMRTEALNRLTGQSLYYLHRSVKPDLTAIFFCMAIFWVSY